MTTNRYHLLQPPGATLEVGRLARELARDRDAVATDVAVELRDSGGILAQDFDDDHAERFSSRTEQVLGWRPLRIPADALMPPVRNGARTVRLFEDELTIGSQSGAITERRLSDFAAVAIFGLGRSRPEASAKDRATQTRNDWAPREHPALRAEFDRTDFAIDAMSIALVTHATAELTMVEPGTMFPERALIDRVNALDNWIDFVDNVLASVESAIPIPETLAFWRKPKLETWLEADRRALDRRLIWLVELVEHGLWPQPTSPLVADDEDEGKR